MSLRAQLSPTKPPHASASFAKLFNAGNERRPSAAPSATGSACTSATLYQLSELILQQGPSPRSKNAMDVAPSSVIDVRAGSDNPALRVPNHVQDIQLDQDMLEWASCQTNALVENLGTDVQIGVQAEHAGQLAFVLPNEHPVAAGKQQDAFMCIGVRDLQIPALLPETEVTLVLACGPCEEVKYVSETFKWKSQSAPNEFFLIPYTPQAKLFIYGKYPHAPPKARPQLLRAALTVAGRPPATHSKKDAHAALHKAGDVLLGSLTVHFRPRAVDFGIVEIPCAGFASDPVICSAVASAAAQVFAGPSGLHRVHGYDPKVSAYPSNLAGCREESVIARATIVVGVWTGKAALEQRASNNAREGYLTVQKRTAEDDRKGRVPAWRRYWARIECDAEAKSMELALYDFEYKTGKQSLARMPLLHVKSAAKAKDEECPAPGTFELLCDSVGILPPASTTAVSPNTESRPGSTANLFERLTLHGGQEEEDHEQQSAESEAKAPVENNSRETLVASGVEGSTWACRAESDEEASDWMQRITRLAETAKLLHARSAATSSAVGKW